MKIAILPRFYKILSYILFFLMLFSPFAFNEIKMVSVSFLFVSILFYLLIHKEKIIISKDVILWFSVFILHGFFFTYIGVLNGADLSNVIKFSTISIVWPLFFFLLFFFKTDKKYFIRLYNVMVLALVIISIYVIYKVLSIFGYLPAFDIYKGKEGDSGLMMNDGIIEMSIPAATTLMFAVPSVITLYLFTKEKRLIPIILLAFIAVVLTSRRALILNVIVTPIICLFFAFFFMKKKH